MEVYRICDKNEVDQIINSEDLSNIGSYGSEFIRYNCSRSISNHKYYEDERYLHFFKDKDSILYWFSNKGRYVCTYNIPDEILNGNLSYGKYCSVFSEGRIVDVAEYAIESKLIDKNYLEKVEILNDTIDICDDDYYESLDSFFDLVFEKDKNTKKLVKSEH